MDARRHILRCSPLLRRGGSRDDAWDDDSPPDFKSYTIRTKRLSLVVFACSPCRSLLTSVSFNRSQRLLASAPSCSNKTCVSTFRQQAAMKLSICPLLESDVLATRATSVETSLGSTSDMLALVAGSTSPSTSSTSASPCMTNSSDLLADFKESVMSSIRPLRGCVLSIDATSFRLRKAVRSAESTSVENTTFSIKDKRSSSGWLSLARHCKSTFMNLALYT